MSALDPKTCTRCKREVPADDPDRPHRLHSRTFAPANPRPTMPSGTAVSWEVKADYQDPEGGLGVHALLCASCVDELRTWIYQFGSRPRSAPGQPVQPVQVGDRVEITVTGTVSHAAAGTYPIIQVELDSDIASIDDEERVTTPVISDADRIVVLPATGAR